jgi:hypothetical protein
MREEDMTDPQQESIAALHNAFFTVPLHVQAQVAADIIDKVHQQITHGDPLYSAKYTSNDLRCIGREMEAADLKRREEEAVEARRLDDLAIALRREWHRGSADALVWDRTTPDSQEKWRSVARFVRKMQAIAE